MVGVVIQNGQRNQQPFRHVREHTKLAHEIYPASDNADTYSVCFSGTMTNRVVLFATLHSLFNLTQVVLLGGQAIWYARPSHHPTLDLPTRAETKAALRRDLRLKLGLEPNRRDYRGRARVLLLPSEN